MAFVKMAFDIHGIEKMRLVKPGHKERRLWFEIEAKYEIDGQSLFIVFVCAVNTRRQGVCQNVVS
jgi:hypothetical protein